MMTEQTIKQARAAADALRRVGDADGATTVEALIAAVRDEAVPALDLLTTTQTGSLLGVTGQAIKNWVREGRFTGYRVGSRIMIPRTVVEEYVRRAGPSLDMVVVTA